MSGDVLLEIEDLSIGFRRGGETVQVLRGVSAIIRAGRIVGVVGESGSGKSTLASAILGLLPANLGHRSGTMRFQGRDLLTMGEREAASLRGTEIAMVFQDPLTALNPVFTVGSQLVDMQRARRPKAARRALLDRAAAMLGRVGIPDAAHRLADYPHQFSGGMRQRIMIAAALLCEPALLIADEPTTALDPTIEVQIVRLIEEVRADFAGAIMLISHSLGLVAELSDDVIVLYAGTVVESAPADALFRRPRHPYTQALLACEIDEPPPPGARFPSIPGELPDLVQPPPGCIFASRCPQVIDACRERQPPLLPMGPAHAAACIRAEAAETPAPR